MAILRLVGRFGLLVRAASTCLLVGLLPAVRARAQTPAPCGVMGTVTSGRIPLPGVVISLNDANDRSVDVSSSTADGTYAIRIPAPGEYTLKAELVAFAPIVRSLSVDARLTALSRPTNSSRAWPNLCAR